ncbi:MAG: NBR1-Ig-like domain-containing protein [Chloroflexota bacterium]
MRYTKKIGLTGLFILSLVLSACNLGKQPEPTPDVGAIFTAAAQTMLAQYSTGLTQTAQAVPPTATSIPSSTPIPTFSFGGSPAPTLPFGSPVSPLATPLGGTPLATITPLAALATQAGTVCNNSEYIADITYPDGEVVQDKQLIAKVWQIKNTGTCTWDDGYALRHVMGESLGGMPWEITSKSQFVEPGEIVEIRIDMQTGTQGGERGGCWQMYGDDGYNFGTLLCIKIIVK